MLTVGDEFVSKVRYSCDEPFHWFVVAELFSEICHRPGNAFELSVWMSKQGGQPRVTPENAAVALHTFKADLGEEMFIRRAALELSDVRATFGETVTRHTAKHGFRTYDIVHVVSARLLGCDHFFSFDERARKLAALEGLKVSEL